MQNPSNSTRNQKSLQKNGLFISFEGIDGSGKSSLLKALANRLSQAPVELVLTREPGGCPLSEELREWVLKREMHPKTELFLYEAARAEHLTQSVLPALKRGAWVLCDRFTASTLAYQSEARGLPWKEIQTLNRIASFGLKSDLCVLLDIAPEKGLARAKDPNRFEAMDLAFHKKVRAGFLKAKREDPKRWLRLSSESLSPEELLRELIEKGLSRFQASFPFIRELL